jgi:zinc protease
MARQEKLGDRLSDQGYRPEARGEAFVIHLKASPNTASLNKASLNKAPGKMSAMRLAFVVAAGLVLTPLASTPSHAAAKIQHLISPGGIEAWFVQDATVPLIAMEYAFGGGSAQDPADKPGVGNMVADLLDEGSGDLDSKTFHERLDRRAIELSFNSSRDHFRGSLRMLKDTRDEAFELLRTSLTSPHFDSEDVERIRSQIISNLRRDTSNPTALASHKFLELAFGDHPYGRDSDGTLESVPKIDVADLKDYVRRVLAKDTLKIAVVGDVDAATLGQLLDKTFGGLPAKATLTPVADIEATKPPQRAFIPLDVPQTVVMFGGPGIRRHDPNFMAGYVVNHILGGGTLSSRLYHEVREKRGLAYSVYESLLWMDHSALFIGNTGTRADRAGETVDAINKEVRRMAEDGPTQQELDEAKSYLKGSQMLALDTSSKLASALLQYQLDRMPIDYIEKRNAIVDAVTLDDAKNAAKRLWGQGLLTVIVGRAPQAAAQPAAATPPPTAN